MSKTRDHNLLMRWLGEVSKAALPFESRWTKAALKRVDPDLAQRLHEQRGLFDKACVVGEGEDIEAHGAAMCRGWAAAVRVMEGAGEPDDAYQIGRCPRTGFVVAVGAQKAAAARVVDLQGQRAVWVSPDEIASLLAGLEGFKMLVVAKQLWPGAELIDVRPDEPAQNDWREDEPTTPEKSEDAA